MYSINGNYAGIKFGKTENLHAEYLRIMSELNIQIPDGLNQYFALADKINISPHAPYLTYYNDALADKVYQSEKTIIERFNYTFN
jgi:hypothetical protein